MSLDYWNNIYRKHGDIGRGDARWLDPYESLLNESKEKALIDLGCGSGSESIYLLNHGYSVISCDFSREILERLASSDRRIQTRQFDIRERLPFDDSAAHIVIASLSLHYFSWAETEGILRELRRILDKSGYLICRLNSVNDIHYGAGRGIEVEPGYYNDNGNFKRFFDSRSIDRLFSQWNILEKKECDIHRYDKPKKAWQCLFQSRDD